MRNSWLLNTLMVTDMTAIVAIYGMNINGYQFQSIRIDHVEVNNDHTLLCCSHISD